MAIVPAKVITLENGGQKVASAVEKGGVNTVEGMLACLSTGGVFDPSVIPKELAEKIIFADGESLQKKFDDGKLGGTSSASAVSYHNTTYTNVEAALDALLYVAPVITSFTNDVGTVEIGSTVNDVNLAWAYNKTMTTQVINQSVGDIPAGTFTAALTGLALVANRTWTLSASDGTNTVTRNTSISFMNKRYWGVSSATLLSVADILALSQEFASGRAQTKTMNATGGKYLYFVMPTAFNCDPSKFKINGLYNSAWVKVTDAAFTNTSGHTSSYDIFRSQNLQTGSNIAVEIV